MLAIDEPGDLDANSLNLLAFDIGGALTASPRPISAELT